MASRAGMPTPWTIPLQATRVLLARAPTTLFLHRQAGLTHPNAVSHRWASVEPSPVAPKPWSSLRRSVGPTHACQTAPSEHVDPPGLPHKLLLGTSSRQISNAYLGGILVWQLSYIILLFGGSLGSGHSRLGALPQDSMPTMYYHTQQIRITFIVVVDVQWGKKVFSQPPIVQVLPLKKMREACNFHHRYTSTMRDKIRKENPENHVVGFLKNLFANYGGK